MATADWTQSFELQGAGRQAALDRADEVLRGWGLVMPAGEPLVLHFGLETFEQVGEIEYWIANDTVNRYCGKFLFLFEGQRCPSHYHEVKDETFFIVRGQVAMTVEGAESLMEPGSVLKMLPGSNHTFAAVNGPALVLEVSLPSIEGDNFFADPRIGDDGVI